MSPLLNYTTEMPVEKTIAEIEKMLSQSGAEKILKEYDKEGNVISIAFKLSTAQGVLTFRLPMNQKAVMQVINEQTGEYKRGRYGSQRRIVPLKYLNDYSQASRVGWRIIKDWLEAQLALLFLQMVKPEEIFLPYLYNERTNQTMFEVLEQRGFRFELENKSE